MGKGKAECIELSSINTPGATTAGKLKKSKQGWAEPLNITLKG